jgi:DNA-binding CsgD family transcriptional regulator
MPSPDSIRGDILRLAHRGLGFDEFARAAARVLRRAVPFDRVAVVAFDPATALPVERWSDSAVDIDIDELRQLAASGRRAARTAGDTLSAVCVGEAGLWGAIVLHRAGPGGSQRELELLAALAGAFPEVQRVRLERVQAAGDRDPGLLLLDDENEVAEANAAAAAWLEDLCDDGRLPLAVTAVAHRARALTSGRCDAAARARVRAASGRWVVVRGSVLGRARTAVTLEPARASELVELIADAYGITAREREVTELIAQGMPNAEIAARLYMSPYTVQDHLKAVFEKLGVSSRGQLVARLYLDEVGGRLSAAA